MIPDWQVRTGMLLGEAALDKFAAARVAVVGIGGVGAMAAEMLVRAGIGQLTVIDSDCVGSSNINRQLLALHSTIGKSKVEVLSQRLLDINPQLRLHAEQTYLTEENIPTLLPVGAYDYVLDAIDTISPKVALIQHCLAGGIPLVSSMGSGAKLDATAIRVADISKTNMCPLAHMLRKRLHKLGIQRGFLAVYSEERPLEGSIVLEESRNKKSQAGTISYMPAVFGI